MKHELGHFSPRTKHFSKQANRVHSELQALRTGHSYQHPAVVGVCTPVLSKVKVPQVSAVWPPFGTA